MKPVCETMLVLVAFLAMACGAEEGPHVRDLTAQEQSLVRSSNDFGFKLFREVVTQSDGGDVFVSPLSVSLALGMTYNGARGSTEEGMRETLSFGELAVEEINEGFRGLIDLLTNLDPKVQMEIANSIWYRQGFQVLEAFIEVNRVFFDALVTAMDFSDPGAADTINAWVADKTHGKIDEIVQPPIHPLTVMFLINAVYFKGTWTTEFDQADTRDAVFHAPSGDKTVKMMKLHAKLPYLENENFQAVDLPYGYGLFSMTVLLPKPDMDVDELVASFTRENWESWQPGLVVEEGHLALPRFELEYEQTLNDVLIALGMGDAFSDSAADFTGIRASGGLYISEVKHKSYVKVNEEGTEAAAVTSVEIGETSVPETFHMLVDRPFLFVIADKHSGAILFVGKIVEPVSD